MSLSNLDSTPCALVIHENADSLSVIKNCCSNIFAAVGKSGMKFHVATSPLPPSTKLAPEPYDLVILWISKNFDSSASTLAWVDDWAEARSSGAGGTLACFVNDEDEGLAVNFWKLFGESVGGWTGIDFHWHRISKGTQFFNLGATIASELRERNGIDLAAAETNICDFVLEEIH